MSELISCVIPVYNGEQFLAEAINSVIAQDYEPVEIVVVDDGSTDGTAKILQSYRDKVRFFRQENAGPVAARNAGFARSTGDFICFLDADDLWEANRLSVQHSALAHRRDLDFVVCHIQNFWVDELAEERDAFWDHPRSRPVAGYTSAGLLACRQAFERVGLFQTELGHADSADWFLRAKEMGLRGHLLDEVLVRRRIHPESRSRLRREHSSEEFLRLAKGMLDRHRGVGQADSP